MKRIIRLTENDLARIVKRVISESIEPPADKKLNLSCKGDNFFDLYDFYLYDEKDINGGIDGGGFKRLTLQRDENSPIPIETYDPRTILLDITPANLLNPKFLEKNGIDPNSGDLLYITHKSSRPYYCAPNSGTDSAWYDYFDSL